MKTASATVFRFGLLLLLCWSCKEPFEPEVSSVDHSILVVEGHVEVGGGETMISVARTRPVYDSVSTMPIQWAVVSLEGEDGSSWSLHLQESGQYLLFEPLPENQNYRLRIQTDGQTYLSDWLTPIITPEISEISFEKKEGDVSIYVSTQGNERAQYFMWEYEETWIYQSPYRSSYKYDVEQRDVVPLGPDDQLTFRCWNTDRSRQINISSSERYQNDYIYQKELLKIGSLSEKLGERYSILVTQRAVEREAFVFWEAIRKNSNDIGGIFSPLPSSLSGNMHNIDDPQKPVIGYITAGKSAQKRQYISRREVDPWRIVIDDYHTCAVDTIIPRDYEAVFVQSIYVPLSPYCTESGGCIGYFASTRACADCSMRGGVLERPEFWED